ncbi:MAG: acetate--CoA ligase family protein [Beijerinckiaceae bacterium]
MANDTATAAKPSSLFASLEPLFRPRGVAIVGASSTPFKQGNSALKYLVAGGYEGGIYPVNPSGGEIEGLKAYASIADIGAPVDCALFVIPAGAVIPAIEECARAGVKSVVIGANGFAELGTEKGFARQRELTRIARENRIRIVGPNTNGIWNATDRLSLGYNTSHGDSMTPGPVSIAAHSGALFNSIAPSLRRFGAGLSKFIPVGNEADLDMLDFLEYFIEDPATGVIGLIVEALRDGERAKKLAAKAHAAGKPVVALKLGRSAAGAGAALAHSSRMAGNARAYDALFRETGILQVPTIEALAGACALLSGKRPSVEPDKRGLICVSSSGGGGGLVADFASEYGIPLAGNPDGSWSGKAADLIATFDGAGPVFNPIDGGNLHGWDRLEKLLHTLESEGHSGPVLYFGHMLPRGQMDMFVQEILARRKERTGAPVVCVAPGGLRPDVEEAYRSHAIPVFNDMATCFMSLRALYRSLEFEPQQPFQTAGLSATAADAVGAMLSDAAGQTMLSESRSADILRTAGVVLVESTGAPSLEAAVDAAAATGYPVVLKGLAPGIAHKNDAGLVAAGLAGEAALREAHARIAGLLAKTSSGDGEAEIILQPMIAAKAELIIGIAHEPPLGHFLVAGLGGIYAEVLDEILLIPAPSSAETIRARISGGRIGALLAKIGKSPEVTDRLLESVTDNLLALQNLLCHFGEKICSVDVNPLLIREDGVIGVDALIELR